MTTGFRSEYGGRAADLDELFEPGNAGVVTGFKTADGRDLGEQFAPLAGGSPLGYDTGFKVADGVTDLSALFAKRVAYVAPSSYQTLTAAVDGAATGFRLGGVGSLVPDALYGRPVGHMLDGFYAGSFSVQFNAGSDAPLFGSTLFLNGKVFNFSSAIYSPFDSETGAEPVFLWQDLKADLLGAGVYAVTYQFPEPVLTASIQAGSVYGYVGLYEGYSGSVTYGSGLKLGKLYWNEGENLTYFAAYSPDTPAGALTSPDGLTASAAAVQVNGGPGYQVFLPERFSLNSQKVGQGNPLGLVGGQSYSVAVRRAVLAETMEITVGLGDDAGAALYGYMDARWSTPTFGAKAVPNGEVPSFFVTAYFWHSGLDTTYLCLNPGAAFSWLQVRSGAFGDEHAIWTSPTGNNVYSYPGNRIGPGERVYLSVGVGSEG